MASALPWIRVARLHFYPLALLVLTTGAVVAARETSHFLWPSFLLTALAAVITEFITVLTNEIEDFDSDSHNTHAGPFNGGSRVLVDGQLTATALRTARLFAFGCLFTVAAILWFQLPEKSRLLMLAIGIFGMSSGFGYSAKPIRLSARGWGELAVATAHSYTVFFAGFASQGGEFNGIHAWLLPLPTFFAILPSILLSGIPDATADASAGKRTLAVRYGPQKTVALALLAATAAAAAMLAQHRLAIPLPTSLCLLVACHLATIFASLLLYLRGFSGPTRIDCRLALTLAYVPWFPIALLLAA